MQDVKGRVKEKETMISESESEHRNTLTEDNFVNYTKSCVEGTFDKYHDLFSEDEDLVRVHKAFQSCKLFDVLFLCSGPSVESLEHITDKLVHFEYEELDDDFLQSLKKDISKLLKLMHTMPYKFEVEDTEKEPIFYHVRLEEKAQHTH